jgi:hypothetical protein
MATLPMAMLVLLGALPTSMGAAPKPHILMVIVVRDVFLQRGPIALLALTRPPSFFYIDGALTGGGLAIDRTTSAGQTPAGTAATVAGCP